MGPRKNMPKKSAADSSSQQASKGKEVIADSPIPHFGPTVEKEVEVGPDAFFEAERIVLYYFII